MEGGGCYTFGPPTVTLFDRRLHVRGVTDCLIAQGCVEYGASLLTLDRDFKTIARHSSLKLIETP